MKKRMSLLLSVCLSLAVILSSLLLGGVNLAYAAASSSYTQELWLMNDYGYAMSRGEKILVGKTEDDAPYAYETGTSYIPLDAVCYYADKSTYTVKDGTVTVKSAAGATLASFNVGGTSWTNGSGVAGEFLLPVVMKGDTVYLSILSHRDIFGLAASFYNKDSGVVVLSFSSMSYNMTYSSEKTQVDTMAALLFDRPSADAVYSAIQNGAGVGTHPSILADDAKFAELREIVNGSYATQDDGFAYYVQSYANRCKSSFSQFFAYDEQTGTVSWYSEDRRNAVSQQPYYIYFDTDGDGIQERLVGRSEYTYYDSELGEEVTIECPGSGRGDGYDVGGRSNVDKYTTHLKQLGFAWQITLDDRYADAFYLMAVELGKWEHWGEGHFLDCADGSVEFAIGFDWIYHAFDDEPEKRDEMAKILYDKGLYKGYLTAVHDGKSASVVSSHGIHVSYTAGTGGWRTVNRDNNWQTVCGSGMIVSALALAEYDEYRDVGLYCIETYLRSLEKCLMQYAPDGAYIESPGYWGYGTNTLCITLASLQSVCHDTFGYEDIIGLHDSFYFAAGIADSKYQMWNYHDCGSGMVDHCSFYFASSLWHDPYLAAYRDKMLFVEQNVSATMMDVLFYDPELSGSVDSSDMPLDYNFKGIDTAIFRSSWESDAVFAGLHSGPSVVTHGDMDTGNFTLSMGGLKWISEPGTEDYNYPGFWNNNTRYHLYGKSVEGHSTIVIRDSSLPFGQAMIQNTSTSAAEIDTYYSDENGGYAVTDMRGQYGSACSSAYRGLLLTNSRTTVVVQDDISFSSPTSLTAVYNLMHYITFPEGGDGRTIYVHDWVENEKVTMRVTLLSDNPDLRFVRKKDTVLTSTITKNQNNTSGHDGALNPVQRVVIEADNVTEYHVAVVFELIRHEDEVVGYKYADMTEWETVTDEWVKEENSDIVYPEEIIPPKYTQADFVWAIKRIESAFNDVEIGNIIRETYVYTTDYDTDHALTLEKVAIYMEYVNAYYRRLELANKLYRDTFLGI